MYASLRFFRRPVGISYRSVLMILALLLPVVASAMPPVQHWTTPNGARVYFVPAPELPMTDIRVVFDAGSARDGGREGLAQLTAALLDKGAAGYSADEIAAGFEGLGARFGGAALRDMASWSLRSLTSPELLQPAAKLMSEVLGRPAFDSGSFDRERKRMLVAVKARGQQPKAIAEEAFFKTLYAGHPYASIPGGNKDSLAALTRADVQAFYRQFYVARNAVVAIVGDVDRAAAEALAIQVTGLLKPGTTPPALPPVPDLKQAVERHIAHPSTQVHIWMGQPGMRRLDPDYFSLYVGNHILGGSGLVSRLSEEIREKRGLSYSVYSYFMPMAQTGPYRLGLQTRADQLDEALGLLRDNLRRYVKEGPTEKELVAAKKNITGGQALRIASNSKIVEYLSVIGFYHLPVDYLQTFNEHVNAVTVDSIRDAFKRRVHPNRLATIIVGAEQSGSSGNSD